MYSKGILSYNFFFSKLLHLKKSSISVLADASAFWKNYFPHRLCEGRLVDRRPSENPKWQHITIICIVTYSSFVTPQAQEPKIYISLCCTHCKPNIKAEWNVDFEFLICCPLSVRLNPTVEVPKIKNTNLSKDSIQFCISHFLGTNTGLPTLSLSRSATSLSHSCDHDQLQHLDLLLDYLYNKILLPHRHHCDTQHQIRKRNSVGDISNILAY